MEQVSISLSNELSAWAASRVAAGSYANTSDYVRELVQRDLAAADDSVSWLQSMIDAGRAAPPVDGTASEVLADIIAESRANRV